MSRPLWAHIAEVDGKAAACAMWFRTFSTWDGVAGIYLEDLFVRPEFRRRGLARKLLAALARECVDADGARLSWAVLDWNVNAIALYDAVGGKQQNDWITYRVSGPELSALAPNPERRPLQRRRAEQQGQYGQRHDRNGDTVEPLSDPTPMYQATGNRSSWANTAMPRPHRRPVHSAQPAASTAEPMITNHPAVPNLFIPGSSFRAPRSPRTRPPRSRPASPSSDTTMAA